MRFISIFLLLLGLGVELHAQEIAEDLPEYPFIKYQRNHIEFKGDSINYQRLYRKLDSMILVGEGKINVVHMGGSHIQAGVLSSHFARRLQTFFPGLKGSRGFVFPYRIARTNNPRSYRSSFSGKWTSCRSTQRKKVCELGLSGISGTTETSGASVTITPSTKSGALNYQFSKVRVFHKAGRDQFSVDFFPRSSVVSTKTDTLKGITYIQLHKPTDTLKLKFVSKNSQQKRFVLHGITLENENPGFTYYPIGVNGTTIPSYLKTQLFDEHLHEIAPDWVILTLGTNDAYGRHFDPARYKDHYRQLLDRIQKAAPNAVVLLTVPNDSYLYRRYPNKNTAKTAQVIAELSKEYGVAMWNFYEIMGGLNSVAEWQQYRLAKRDKIHFTPEGYKLQADLLFAAFVSSYERYHLAMSEQGVRLDSNK